MSTTTSTTDTPQLDRADSKTWPRKEDGKVNWRAMVRPEHLYVKKEHAEALAKRLGKAIGEITVADAEDRHLVIRKAGILELADLRGYSSAIPKVSHVQRDYVVVTTLVEWKEFEGTDMITTGGVGEAHPDNTSQMGSAYLAAMAENRAFARAVRQFLQVDIVSSDELGSNQVAPETNEPSNGGTSSNPVGPQAALQRAAEATQVTFEQVKKAAQQPKIREKLAVDETGKCLSDPDSWKRWDDVAPRDCNTLINLLREGKKARDEAAAKGK